MRVLALVTEAFGGRGGIAAYNRDLASAIAVHPACEEVVLVPRLVRDPDYELPEKVHSVDIGAKGKWRFLSTVLREAGAGGSYNAVVCGHLHLLPVAVLAKRLIACPLVLFAYGIEAWKPRNNRLFAALIGQIDLVVSISEFTSRRFVDWSGVSKDAVRVCPNAVHLDQFGAGSKSEILVERYGLRGCKVLMTVGRLDRLERYKGVDLVLELLPALARKVPNIVYLIAGEGDDRPRLAGKAQALGIADRVRFTGWISEQEKADHYRLADVFVMPGTGEGFGFVFLEAMACGVPVVASAADGSREAVRDGKLGIVVNPNDPDSVIQGILRALAEPPGRVPTGLEFFAYPNFVKRVHCLLDLAVAGDGS